MDTNPHSDIPYNIQLWCYVPIDVPYGFNGQSIVWRAFYLPRLLDVCRVTL